MQVKVTPKWTSSGKDHHIKNGYMVLNEVVESVLLDGEQIDIEMERYYEVVRIEDNSPEAIHLYSG